MGYTKDWDGAHEGLGQGAQVWIEHMRTQRWGYELYAQIMSCQDWIALSMDLDQVCLPSSGYCQPYIEPLDMEANYECL